MIYRLTVVLVILAAWLLTACGGGSSASGVVTEATPQPGTLQVVAGSENRDLEPLIDAFAKKDGFAVQMTYKGSVDIMRELENGTSTQYDAVWPANSLWIALGDNAKVVKNQKSVWRSPVVLGVKRSIAERLGWTTRKDVTVGDILAAAKGGKLRFMMTSATQSNSGASAYFGMLYAFAGKPEVLTAQHLQDAKVREQIHDILGSVNRSAGSSGFLEDLFLKDYDSYDAMFNYETLVVDTDKKLTAAGKEPLYVVYPVDGLAIADSPLGYVDKGDANKEATFKKLQDYLTGDAQKDIQATGRRVGLGLDVQNPDPAVFNPQWGIDTKLVITPIVFPPPDVVRQALVLYQTAFRKPSFTVFCLDFSGSMQGDGESQLTEAMRTLLIQQEAEKYLLQSSPQDVTVVLPFNSAIKNANEIDQWTVRGNDPSQLQALFGKVDAASAGGGTNIYLPAIRGLELLKQGGYENYSPAIILMTDGKSDDYYSQLVEQRKALGMQDVPIYSITFGDADDSQLQQIAELTSGKVFSGKTDLVGAFREAKGYN